MAAGAPPVQAAAQRRPGAGGAGVGADCTGLMGTDRGHSGNYKPMFLCVTRQAKIT